MIILIILIGGLLFFTVRFISPGCQITENGNGEKKHSTFVLVFCDVSTSMGDTTTYHTMIEYSLEILRWMHKAKCRGRFYLINSRTINPNWEFKVDFSKKISKRDYFALEHQLYSEIINIKPDTSNRVSSCIIDAFRLAKETFDKIDTSKYVFELIILSDMMEHCTNSVFHRYVDLCSQHTLDKDICRKLIPLLPDTLSICSLSMVRVSIILTTYASNRPQCWEEFWKKFFKSCNVKELYFAPGIPPTKD
ncbi:MAG: hypothetical protein ONB45_02790 [candidate division KSB1 bacterium]|nr:hypothetical protein [candidate division KSB1 bacterium]